MPTSSKHFRLRSIRLITLSILVVYGAHVSAQSVEWSPYRQSPTTEMPVYSTDEFRVGDSSDADSSPTQSPSMETTSPTSEHSTEISSGGGSKLPRISTRTSPPTQLGPPPSVAPPSAAPSPWDHLLPPPAQPIPQSSVNTATTVAEVKDELRAMTRPSLGKQRVGERQSALDTQQPVPERSDQQVAQMIDWFLTPDANSPSSNVENKPAAIPAGRDPRSVNAAVQAFRRRLLGESSTNQQPDQLGSQTLPTGTNHGPATELRPSDTRKVIPFGVRNDRVEVKSHGENISLVARDAPLKEILSMLAKSQKLNLIFASTPPPFGLAQGRLPPGAAAPTVNGTQPQAAPNSPQPSGGGGIASRLLAAGTSAVTGPATANVGQPGVAGAAAFNAAGVNANMTVTLEDVQLDTALDMILSVAGFTWTRTQGIILVTPTDGTTQLPPNAQGRIMQVFELDFAVAEDLDTAIQGLLSPVGQSFATASLFNDNRRSIESIVVEDMPRYVDRIAQYISQVDVPPRQVAIQAYILEVELGSNLRHGVNLEYLANLLDPGIRFGSTGFARTTPSQAFFLELDATRLDGLLDALRTTVDAKTLASPRIIAVNGQESRLQVGEQLGFRITTTTQTSTLESVQFLNVGVVLAVTPRISRDGRVLLHVRPEVSSGQVNPETGLPEEETAELQTDVLLDDGQGIVVGGLIKEDINNGQSKVPVLGDVPYLGALFENRAESRARTEIIVALVPKVLPLDQPRHDLQNIELDRARTPLMRGALVENARPYEPSLPDPLRTPIRKYHQRVDWEDQRQAARYGYETPQRGDLRTSALRQASYEEAYLPRRHVAPHRTQHHSKSWQFLRPKIWSKR